MTIQPRSKATVHNRAMSGHVMYGPRHRNDTTGTSPWVPMPHEDREEPHDWATAYTDSKGNLSVALDCGMCFKPVPQHQVFDGTADLTCDIAHRKRDDATYNSIRNVATMTFKTGIQS